MSATSILIVEDEAIVAVDLGDKLQQLGYTLSGTAATGERAIELARQQRPSLVLMDIHLAGAMDGIAAADTIRRELDIPVVFLTAYSDTATLDRAKVTEPFGYVIKPFEERELRSTIEMAIYKHQADLQLRQHREWLRVTLASIGDAVIACDSEARVTYLNPVAEAVTGWKMQEALGRQIQSVLRLINEQTRQPCEDPVACVLREGRPVGLANRTVLLSKDGREVAIEDSAAPILDASGGIAGVVLVFHDVTEKRRAQERLEVSQHRQLEILESIADGFFSLDQEYRVTYINERGAQLVGKPRAELLDRSLWESFPEAVGTPFHKAYQRTLTERVPTRLEAFYPPLNAWFEVRAYPAKEGLSVFYQDVTERKRLEEQSRLQAAALQAAANAVAITDGEGLVQWVNPAFTRLTGYAPAEVVGRNPRTLKSGAHPPEFYRDMWHTVLTGQIWRGELVNRRKDGSLYTEDMTITPVTDDRGAITHFVAIKQDVTERKQLEDALRFLVQAGTKPDEDFFAALASYLAGNLGMEYVCVDRLEEGLLRAQTLAVYHDGKFADNVAYTLKDTPCGELVGQAICCFPREVRRLFPKDAALQGLQAESYVGATLWSSKGLPIGLIAVIGRQPLANPKLAESILRLVSVRAAAELERRNTDRAREAHLLRLKHLVEVSRQVLAAPTNQELMQRIVDAAQQLTNAQLGVCGHGFQDGHFQIIAASRTEGQPPCPPGEVFHVERGGVHMELIEGRNTIRYTDAQLRARPQWWGLPAEHAPLRGLLGARLVGRDSQSVGVILVSDKRGGDFTSEDEALLGQLAALCSVGMQHLAATESAEQRAEQLATVFGSMTNGVMILNPEGVMVDANRALVEACGFNPINQPVSTVNRKLNLRCADGKHLPAARLPSRRALGGEIVRGERLVFTAPDGEERVIVVSAAPLRVRRQVTGAVVVWHDVTEREALLASVARARDELEARVDERTAELKQTVALLQESEERFRTLFEAVPLGISRTTYSGQMLDANPALCELLGGTLQEIQAGQAADFYAKPGDRKRLLASVRRSGFVDEFETFLAAKNGRVFPALLRSTRVSFRGQRALLNTIQDVTQRKQAEKHLHGIAKVLELFATKPGRGEYLAAAVALLRDWCACGAAGIRILDSRGCLPYAAALGFPRRFLKAEGDVAMSAGECACVQVLRGHGSANDPASPQTARDFFCNNVTEFLKRSAAHADAAAAMPCVKARFESIAHVPIRFHDRFLGSIHLADRRPDRFTPEIIGFIDSVASFMGEALHRFQVEESLHESEERFRSMFEKHDAIMLLMDPASGGIVDANPAAAAFYGCTREHLRTLNAGDLGFQQPHTLPAKSSGAWTRSWKRMETTTRLGAGGARTVEVYASPISLQRRQLLFAIMHDVTERKVLERQIIEISEQERQRIGRDLHDSLGGHLTGLALLTKALAQMLEEQGQPQAPMATDIANTLNDAIGMTRAISHGLCPIEPGAQGLINGLHEFVMGIRQRTGVACRFRVEGNVSIPDAVVATHLFRIVEEAVQNAVRHAKPKQIEVRLCHVRAGLSLTVWNDGRPLPDRLDMDKGLGLRTMRYRANLVGGDLELRRAARGGTEVSCLVPDGDAPPVKSTAASSARAPARARPGRRKTRSRVRKKA